MRRIGQTIGQSGCPPNASPEGVGVYTPNPASLGSTIATAVLFTEALGLDLNPLRQNGSIYLYTALTACCQPLKLVIRVLSIVRPHASRNPVSRLRARHFD